MIICVCKNVSDTKIIQEIKNGSSFDDLQMNLGVALRCGCCLQCVSSLIKENTPNLQQNLSN
jgi:bacterioferritin-associated ferredoxin